MTARRHALRVVELIRAKQGGNVLLFDLRRASPVADFFVVATAQSALHARAIADDLMLKLKQAGTPAHHVEGQDSGLWILIDCHEVVVHIFQAAVREFYGLERLWGDLPQRRFDDT